MNAHYEIKLRQPAFVVGESVVLEQSISNHDTQPLTLPDPQINANWQPVYTLNGPSGARRMDLRTLVHGQRQQPPDPATAQLLTIAPGQRWSGATLLDKLFKPREAGRYEVSAELTWSGATLKSNVVPFTLGQSTVESLSVGVVTAQRGREFVLLNSHAGGKIYRRTIGIRRPDLGEASISSAVAVSLDPPPVVDQLLSPTSQHGRSMDECWVYRSGAQLVVQSVTDQLQQLAIGAGQIVDPPWIAKDEALRVAVVDVSRGRLEVIRAERQLGPNSAPMAVVAGLALSRLPEYTSAALRRNGTSGSARITLGRTEGKDLLLESVNFEHDKNLSLTHGVRIADMAFHSDSPFTSQMDPQGNLHVWFVALARGQLTEPGLVHAVLPDMSAGAGTFTFSPIQVESPVHRARTKAFVTESAERASALVRLVDGTVLYVRANGAALPLRSAPPFGSVMELVVTGDNSFLLTFEDGRFHIHSLEELVDAQQ